MGWLWITIAISSLCLATQAQEQRHFGSHCHKELGQVGTLKYPDDKVASFFQPSYEFGSGVNGATNCLFYGRIYTGKQVVLAFSKIFLGSGVIRIETKASSFSNWKLNRTISVSTMGTITINLRGVQLYRIVVPNVVISFNLQYWTVQAPTGTTTPTSSSSTTSSGSTTVAPWLIWWLFTSKPTYYPPWGQPTQPTWPPWQQPTQPTWPPWQQPTQPTWPPWPQPTQPTWPPWTPAPTHDPWNPPAEQTCRLPYGWKVSYCSNGQRQGSYCQLRCQPLWSSGVGRTVTSVCTSTFTGLIWVPSLGNCGGSQPFFP